MLMVELPVLIWALRGPLCPRPCSQQVSVVSMTEYRARDVYPYEHWSFHPQCVHLS